MQGPEDSPNWKTANESSPDYRENRKCAKCGNVIILWHCADTGCPWCAQCGANAKREPK